MKKLIAMLGMVMLTAGCAFAAEHVEIEKVANHYPWDGKVDCVFALSGLDANYTYKGVFTLKVEKNNATERRTVTNDFASADGTYTNTFDCVALFGDGVYPNGGLTVDLARTGFVDATGTPIGIRGDVLVVDISKGSSASSYPTFELADADMGSFNCDVYKTTKIVLRKVSAGSYYCQPGADESTTVTQKLTTRGFYIGVFPVTQRQYELVMGTNPSNFQVDAADNVAAHRPVEGLSWHAVRGSVAAGTAITATSGDSFLKRLVAKTGLAGFDLPTEAQWEIACRAGSVAAYGSCWSGGEVVDLSSANIGEVAWYQDNAASTTRAVGGKKSNLWGLYDMQGNVWEWCRDIYIDPYNAAYVDSPCTSTSFDSGRNRVVRGGIWNGTAIRCLPSGHEWYYAGYGYNNCGFRLMKSLP